MTDHKNIRCRKCRIVLFSIQNFPVVDAHGQEIGTSSEVEGSDSVGAVSCTSLIDKNLIYLYEDTLPDFLQESLAKGSWVKGKINCPKCQSRLGSFNFVTGNHCACHKFQVPPVHLQTSKVDYIQPNEVKTFPISHPDQPLSQTAAEDLPTSCTEMPLSEVQFDDLECLHISEDISPQASAASGSHDVNNDLKTKPTCLPSEKLKNFSCSPGNSKDRNRVCEPEIRRRNRRARRVSDSHSQCEEACCTHATNKQCHIDSNAPLNEYSDKEIVAHSTRYHVLESEDFSETESESSSGSEAIPDELLCPVCLDLLYSPMVVKPCGHIFCDPCLRRLGQPTPHNTFCPLCRKSIGLCQTCPEMSNEAKDKFPDRHNHRWVFEKEHNTQNLPLPYTRNYRVLGLQGRGSRFGRMQVYQWQGWRTLAWILIVDSLGLALVFLIKHIFGSPTNPQSLQRHKANIAAAPQSALDLESSYVDGLTNISQEEDEPYFLDD